MTINACQINTFNTHKPKKTAWLCGCYLIEKYFLIKLQKTLAISIKCGIMYIVNKEFPESGLQNPLFDF